MTKQNPFLYKKNGIQLAWKIMERLQEQKQHLKWPRYPTLHHFENFHCFQATLYSNQRRSQGQAILQLTSSTKENFPSSLSTDWSLQKGGEQAEGGRSQTRQSKDYWQFKFLKKYVHTPAQNIPWHVKIKSSPLTSPASLTTHIWYRPIIRTCLQ